MHLPVQEMQVQSLGQEDPLEKEMTAHSSILAWTKCTHTLSLCQGKKDCWKNDYNLFSQMLFSLTSLECLSKGILGLTVTRLAVCTRTGRLWREHRAVIARTRGGRPPRAAAAALSRLALPSGLPAVVNRASHNSSGVKRNCVIYVSFCKSKYDFQTMRNY